MKKRLLSLILLIAYSVTSFCTAYAAAPSQDAADTQKDSFDNMIALMIDSNVCVVNGETKSVGDVNPTIMQDRTMVPVRFLTESLGGDVKWVDSTKTAVLSLDGTQIDVPIGEDYIVVDGKTNQLDIGGTLVNNRTMLPLRGICEAMGKEVSYDDGMILITEKDFNDRTDDEDDALRNQMLRYQLTKGKVLKPASEMTSIEELAKKSECIVVKSTDMPYKAEEGACYISRGGMNIVNMKGWMKDTQTFVLDFDVYNQRCSYGIVEIYDADGNLTNTEFIYPYKGAMTTSVRTWFKNAMTDIPESVKAIYEYASGNSNYVDYKTQAQLTHITVEAPKDGYMLFTASSAHSELVNKKNIIMAVSKAISIAFSAAGAYKGWKDQDADVLVEEALISEVEKFFTENPEAYITIADIVISALKDNELTATGYKDAAIGILKTIYNALEDSDFNILNTAQSTLVAIANQKGQSLSADFKKNLPLVGQAFNVMDVMAHFFNTIYFLMDADEAKYLSSVVFVFQDAPAIESSNIMTYKKNNYTSGAELPGLLSIKELMKKTIGNKYVIYNDKIYYSWVSDNKGNWDSKLYSCNIDGSDQQLIYEVDSSGAAKFIVSDKRIYFLSDKKYLDIETNMTFDLADLLGKNEIIFYAKGSHVYSYKRYSDSVDIIKTDVDTGKRETITSRSRHINKCFETSDGNIYYLEIEWLEGAWLYQVKDGKSELVYSFNKEIESVEAIVDGVIYYTGDTGRYVYLSYYDLNTQTGGVISQREYFAGGASFYN